MLEFVLSIIAVIRFFCQSRSDTAMEVLALRQQVVVLKRKRPRPTLNSWDRLIWTTLRHLWSHWSDVLVIVKPETVVAWHRAGFRLYWRWRSRPRRGRARITEEVRTLIRRLAEENPDWGAPKIHGELRKLGFVVSERMVARHLRCVQRRGDPGKQWLYSLPPEPSRSDRSLRLLHRADGDFPAVVLLLYHRARAPEDPALQHHSAPDCSLGCPAAARSVSRSFSYRYAILDHDSKFDAEVITFLKATGLEPKRTSIQSPWQNGTAERWVGSCRRDILDHVIALNERHLLRLLRDYVSYYHQDRIHDSLDKDAPDRRAVELKPAVDANVVSMPRLAGQHHRYA